MPEKAQRPVVAVLTPDARHDIRDISRWSELNFGKEAAARYRALLRQAFRDLEANPARPGSSNRPELLLPGARTYHLSLSRNRAGNPGVKRPRHYILYRSVSSSVIEIARILHERSDLPRHLPASYRLDEE